MENIWGSGHLVKYVIIPINDLRLSARSVRGGRDWWGEPVLCQKPRRL